jgi:hypothetical protein
MFHIGLDLSRTRLNYDLLCEDGSRIERGAVAPHVAGLRGLVERVAVYREPACAAIESMNGARFMHDLLEEQGWRVEIADAQKVKGLARSSSSWSAAGSLARTTRTRCGRGRCTWSPRPATGTLTSPSSSLARAAGLQPTMAELNLGKSEADFRVPDGGLHRPGAAEMWHPTAALVVEILTPDDHTWDTALLRRTRSRRDPHRRPRPTAGPLARTRRRRPLRADPVQPADRARTSRAPGSDPLAHRRTELTPHTRRVRGVPSQTMWMMRACAHGRSPS